MRPKISCARFGRRRGLFQGRKFCGRASTRLGVTSLRIVSDAVLQIVATSTTRRDVGSWMRGSGSHVSPLKLPSA